MSKVRVRAGWIAMIALTSIIAGCSSSDADKNSSSGYRDSDKSSTASSHDAATVDITSSHQFSPREVTIRSGEAVLWRNQSSDIHTVTTDSTKVSSREDVTVPSGAKPFHSGEIRPGKTWRQTFTTPGTYRYVCVPHERDGMMGTVVVRPATEPQTR